jgi:hypothetical protein
MISEIYGKLSNSGSNLHDRLEDNLTGNVFGNLRYISFDKAMKKIISQTIYPKSIAETINGIQAHFWNDNIKFWPYDEEGELDALMEFDNVIIGIEVKYLSGISSDDGLDYSESSGWNLVEYVQKESIHQLSRESRIISKKDNKKKKILIFIAGSSSCRYIYEDTIKRNLIESDVELGYITWQTLLIELSKLKLDNEFANLIIEDLIKLLKRKGFDQFKDMSIDDDFLIDALCYFNFDSELKSTLNFDINIDVRGDLYYEFQ